MSNESFIKQLAKLPPYIRVALSYVPDNYKDVVSSDLTKFTTIVDKVNYYIEHMIGITNDHPRYKEILSQRINKALIQDYPDVNQP